MGGPRPLKPIPDDFRDVCATMGRDALRKRYNVGKDVIKRWYREIGGNPRSALKWTRLPVPDDFREIAPKMTVVGLERHYGVGDRMVHSWMKETGIETAKSGWTKPSAHRPVPADFADIAPAMVQMSLCNHYGVSRRILRRWLKESGVKTLGTELKQQPKQSNPGGGMIFRGHPGFKVERLDLRPVSIYNEAADVIRRFVAVSRCDPKGVYDQHGAFWRVGQMILSADEMLERANFYRRRAA